MTSETHGRHSTPTENVATCAFHVASRQSSKKGVFKAHNRTELQVYTKFLCGFLPSGNSVPWYLCACTPATGRRMHMRNHVCLLRARIHHLQLPVPLAKARVWD